MAKDDISQYIEYLKSTPSGKKDAHMVADYEKYLRSQPGITPEHAQPSKLFNDSDRVSASFGDEAGVLAHLPQGFKKVQKDSDGNYIALGPDGKWYKDQNNFFRDKPGLEGWIPQHPINYLESSVGHALPAMGMVAGAGSGLVEGPAAPVAVPALAGVGSAAGEEARQATGRYTGWYKGGPTDPGAVQELVDAAKGGTLAEMGGKVINKLPVPTGLGEGKFGVNWGNVGSSVEQLLDSIKNSGKYAASGVSSMFSGVPREATERTINRPDQMLASTKSGNALETARQAAQEILDRRNDLGAQAKSARENFLENYGNKKTSTTPLFDLGNEFKASMTPNDQGYGAVSLPELSEISKFERKAFTSPEFSSQPLPEAMGSKLLFEEKPTTIDPGVKAQFFERKVNKAGYQTPEMQPVRTATVKNGPQDAVMNPISYRWNPGVESNEIYQPVSHNMEIGKPDTQTVPVPSDWSHYDRPNADVSTISRNVSPDGKMVSSSPLELQTVKDGPAVRMSPVQTQIVKNGPMVKSTPINYSWNPLTKEPEYLPGHEPIQATQLVGVENTVPRQTWDSLLRSADYLDSQKIGDAFEDNPHLTRSDRGVSLAQKQRGLIKSMAHDQDPLFAAADKNYSEFKNNSKIVGNIADEGKMEGVVNNLFSRNKTAQQEAAAKVFPNAYNGPVADLAANRAYDDTPWMPGITKGQAARIGLGTTLGTGAAMAHVDPAWALMLGLGTTAVTDPRVYKYGLAYGSKAAAPVWSLMQKNADQAVPLYLRSKNPWSLTQEKAQ